MQPVWHIESKTLSMQGGAKSPHHSDTVKIYHGPCGRGFRNASDFEQTAAAISAAVARTCHSVQQFNTRHLLTCKMRRFWMCSGRQRHATGLAHRIDNVSDAIDARRCDTAHW